MARFRCPSPTLEAIDAANTEVNNIYALDFLHSYQLNVQHLF